jgi:hypothetical protein
LKVSIHGWNRKWIEWDGESNFGFQEIIRGQTCPELMRPGALCYDWGLRGSVKMNMNMKFMRVVRWSAVLGVIVTVRAGAADFTRMRQTDGIEKYNVQPGHSFFIYASGVTYNRDAVTLLDEAAALIEAPLDDEGIRYLGRFTAWNYPDGRPGVFSITFFIDPKTDGDVENVERAVAKLKGLHVDKFSLEPKRLDFMEVQFAARLQIGEEGKNSNALRDQKKFQSIWSLIGFHNEFQEALDRVKQPEALVKTIRERLFFYPEDFYPELEKASAITFGSGWTFLGYDAAPTYLVDETGNRIITRQVAFVSTFNCGGLGLPGGRCLTGAR